MIQANCAKQMSQTSNRDNWFNEVSNRLTKDITSAAETGIRQLTIAFTDLIIGAENISECAEMLQYVDSMLLKAGYRHIVTPTGELIIVW